MESVVSLTFPLASMVIVLFLLWNDLLRRGQTPRFLLFARSGLCFALAGVLAYNWMTFRSRLDDLPVGFVLLAAVVASAAGVWFFYRGIRAKQSPRHGQADEPLPRIFVNSRDRGDADESPSSREE